MARTLELVLCTPAHLICSSNLYVFIRLDHEKIKSGTRSVMGSGRDMHQDLKMSTNARRSFLALSYTNGWLFS